MHPNSPSNLPLKVFLVEDSPLVRRHLAALIGTIEDVGIVGEAADTDTALIGMASTDADVAVVDLRLAHSTGMDVLTSLVRSSRPVVTIVLTNQTTASVREACLSAGANYFFDKTSEFRLALDTIKGIARDRRAGVTRQKGGNHV
jgi:two-component system response regulator DevR